MSQNKHIEEYLDFYCKKKNQMPFSVLLKGKWGSGKTHFIKQYIKDNKFLHISLYGLSLCSEIDENMSTQTLGNIFELARIHLQFKI